jgi:hypothetical protein
MDEVILRKAVRERLQAGGLPPASARTWSGAGHGAPCALCITPITRDEMEFELECPQPKPPFATFYHLHPRCYAAWELERSVARP